MIRSDRSGEEGWEGNLDQYATRASDYFEIHLTSPTPTPTPASALTRARIPPAPRFFDGISCNGRNWYARACRGITYSRWETERFVHLPRMYVCAATRREERVLSTCRARRFLDFAMPTNSPRYTRNTFCTGKRGASSKASLFMVGCRWPVSSTGRSVSNLHWRLKKMDYRWNHSCVSFESIHPYLLPCI